jgi:large subunit ribosomal protein L15
VHDGIKVLGDGAQYFKTPIYIIASRASKSAIDAIEKNGGKVVCKYYNNLALQDCAEGRIDRISAAPTRRDDIIWYGKHRNRGFMSPATLKILESMPFVEERWKLLSSELGRWKKQEIEEQKR